MAGLPLLFASLLIASVSAGAQDEASTPDTAVSFSAPEADGVQWPSFRGLRAEGVAEGFETAITWNVEEGKRVRWRQEIAGLAHSSPVIWDDRLYLTTAIRLEGEQELRVGLYGDIASVEDTSPFSFELMCLDKETGEELWSRSCWEGVPKYKRHPKGSFAASTPACDAKHVAAFFGQEGLYLFDREGELRWEKHFGDLDSGFYLVPAAQWGFSSSPVLYDDLVIVQCDVQGQSFLAALDVADGSEVWRTDRDEVPTWSTPTVDVREGRAQVICNGYRHIGGYDLGTGAELWKLVGGGDIPVPTPLVVQDLVFVTNAHGPLAPIFAIDVAAKGELSMDPDETDAMVWCHRRRGNYMQTPIAYGDEIYFCSDGGILTCLDLVTGDQRWRERLGAGTTGFSGSGVAADGKLYFTSEGGDVFVIAAGREYELLAVNELGEECMSTPAVSEGVLYFRGRRFLTAIE